MVVIVNAGTQRTFSDVFPSFIIIYYGRIKSGTAGLDYGRGIRKLSFHTSSKDSDALAMLLSGCLVKDFLLGNKC